MSSREDADQQERSRYIQLFLMEGKAEQVLAEDDYRRLRAMFADAVPKPVVDGFARSLSRPGRLTAALNYYRANLGAGGGAWERLANIGPIKVRTALVWGDHDPALGRRGVEATSQYIEAEFELVVLEGAGHWLQFERPAAVSRSLTAAATH